MPQDLSLEPHPSQRKAEWIQALQDGDMALLGGLAREDHPSAAFYTIEGYINGMYRGLSLSSVIPLPFSKTEIESKITRVLPFINEIRDRLGWRIREFDLGLLRLVRRSSALSPILGAGVSMPAGAPSWADLVRLLLEETLDKGIELRELMPASDNPAQPLFEKLPNGSIRLTSTRGTWSVESRVIEVKRYSAEQESLARTVLAEMQEKGRAIDVEILMKGAQVCFDLCGQELFRLLTGAIYRRAKAPSETHRAIARLSHAQKLPERGPGLFPG